MYVFEVGQDFHSDAGLKNPSFDLYGIDAVIPDITHLLENKERIRNFYRMHDDFIGAVLSYCRKSVGVFGTHFTISLVEHALRELNIADYRLYRINHNKV